MDKTNSTSLLASFATIKSLSNDKSTIIKKLFFSLLNLYK